MNATAYPQQGWGAPAVPPAQFQPSAQNQPSAQFQPSAWRAPTHPGPATNLLSILAISAATAGATVLLGIGSLAAIVLGFIALGQVKRSGDDGRLLAIWAIVLGFVTLVALIVATGFGISAMMGVVQQVTELEGP